MGPLTVRMDSFGGELAAHIVAGGAGSVVAGGKFANGAVTGAFGYLFNSVADAIGESATSRTLTLTEIKDAAGVARTASPTRVYQETYFEQGQPLSKTSPAGDRVLSSRVYEFEATRGKFAGETIVVRDHGVGHRFEIGGKTEAPHFNASVKSTGESVGQKHYYYRPLPGVSNQEYRNRYGVRPRIRIEGDRN